MEGYRDLVIYRKAHESGIIVHHFSLKLPKHELYETGSQLRRASKSVSANMVEGYGRRRYPADCLKYLTYSQASCDETKEWLKYIVDLYEDLKPEAERLLSQTDRLVRQVNVFFRTVESREVVRSASRNDQSVCHTPGQTE